MINSAEAWLKFLISGKNQRSCETPLQLWNLAE